MGSVFRKTVTRPLPEGAELFTKAGEQFARWKPAMVGPRRLRSSWGQMVGHGFGQSRRHTRPATAMVKGSSGKSRPVAGTKGPQGTFCATSNDDPSW